MCTRLLWSAAGTTESAIGSDGTSEGTSGIPQKFSAHGSDALQMIKCILHSDVALVLLESECPVAEDKPHSQF